MRRVERKLADWHRLHVRVQDARQRLEATGDAATRRILEEEVRRLTRDADAAIEEVHAALATIKHTPRADALDGQRQG